MSPLLPPLPRPTSLVPSLFFFSLFPFSFFFLFFSLFSLSFILLSTSLSRCPCQHFCLLFQGNWQSPRFFFISLFFPLSFPSLFLLLSFFLFPLSFFFSFSFSFSFSYHNNNNNTNIITGGRSIRYTVHTSTLFGILSKTKSHSGEAAWPCYEVCSSVVFFFSFFFVFFFFFLVFMFVLLLLLL